MTDIELDQFLNTWTAPAPPSSMRRALVAALPAPRRRMFGVPLRLVLIAAAVAFAAVLGAEAINNPILGRFWGRWGGDSGGLYMQTTRMVDPPVAQLKWWFLGSGYSIGGEGGALHGSADMHNRWAGAFYGYEYTLDAQPDGSYRVAFAPLQLSTLRKRIAPLKFNGRIVEPPALPAPGIVRVGEPFDVTLYQNGSERIYDRILLSWTPFPDWPSRNQAPDPHTFELRDAQLYVNGQLVAVQPSAGSGPVIWVHLPGEGRVLAAMDPQGNPRFQAAGHVNGNVMEFESGGTRFRIVCSRPIAPGGDHGVFVYHEQSFENLLDPAEPLTHRPFLGNAGPASLHAE